MRRRKDAEARRERAIEHRCALRDLAFGSSKKAGGAFFRNGAPAARRFLCPQNSISQNSGVHCYSRSISVFACTPAGWVGARSVAEFADRLQQQKALLADQDTGPRSSQCGVHQTGVVATCPEPGCNAYDFTNKSVGNFNPPANLRIIPRVKGRRRLRISEARARVPK